MNKALAKSSQGPRPLAQRRPKEQLRNPSHLQVPKVSLETQSSVQKEARTKTAPDTFRHTNRPVTQNPINEPCLRFSNMLWERNLNINDVRISMVLHLNDFLKGLVQRIEGLVSAGL